MKKYYNKLVRDNTPDIMKNTGKSISFKKVKDDIEYRTHLEKKLKDEIKEYFNVDEQHKLDELYDIVEICMTISRKFYKKGERDFIMNKNKKNIEKGGFDNGTILKSITEI